MKLPKGHSMGSKRLSPGKLIYPFFVLMLLVSLAIPMAAPAPVGAATMYERYNTGDDAAREIYGANWRAQTFTPSTAHQITSVKLLIYREGAPGDLTVSIRATDGSGHPTGTDLCSGTLNANTITTSTSGLWYVITLGAGANLSAGTKYAIVARALTGGDSSNGVWWRFDDTSSAYAGGNRERSSNSGSSWDLIYS